MYIQNDFQKCTPYVTEVTGLLSDPLKVIIACRVHQNALNTYSQKNKYIYLVNTPINYIKYKVDLSIKANRVGLF